MTTAAPTVSGQNSSHTDTSKLNGVLCTTRSPGSSGSARCIHRSRLAIARCDTATPFGRPVDPDVKIT